jgi:hypothetical protein
VVLVLRGLIVVRQKATNGDVISSFLNYQLHLIKISKAVNGMPICYVFFFETAKMTAFADFFRCESGNLLLDL